MTDLAVQISRLERRTQQLEATEYPTGLIYQYLSLSGLRGFWTMAAFDDSGNAFDNSNNVRTLTRNGNPMYSQDGMSSYLIFDGTGDYLSRANEAGIQILGTEGYVGSATRGLTTGGWFRADTLSANSYLISKYTSTGNQRSYALLFSSGAKLLGIVSSDGSATKIATSTSSVSTSTWYFCVLRYDPSTSVDVFLNGEETSQTSSVPSSLFNSSADLLIGSADAGSSLLTGRASLVFLCCTYLSDNVILNLYNQSRVLFGV